MIIFAPAFYWGISMYNLMQAPKFDAFWFLLFDNSTNNMIYIIGVI